MGSLSSGTQCASIIRAERIQGMMSLGSLKWFAEQAMNHRSIVEIGCWCGRTTTAFCDNCPGTVTAVDTWTGSPELLDHIGYMVNESKDEDWLYHEFLRNMAGFSNLEVVRQPSVEAAKRLLAQGRQFDFIFVDGLHDYDNVMADLRAWWPLLERPGGIICGHDFDCDGVKKAVREFFPMIGKGDGQMWVITT